jgi:uncharacterized protein YegP (UPF0339 family)
MAGHFELIDAPDGGFRVRMLDGDGALMAESVTFPSVRAAREGIELAREIAGTGRVVDRSSAVEQSDS